MVGMRERREGSVFTRGTGLGDNTGTTNKEKKRRGANKEVSTMAMMRTMIGRVSTANAIDPLFFMGTKETDSDTYMGHTGSMV